MIGTHGSSAALYSFSSIGNGAANLDSDDGGGRTGGSLSGGNLKSERGGIRKRIEGPDVVSMVSQCPLS